LRCPWSRCSEENRQRAGVVCSWVVIAVCNLSLDGGDGGEDGEGDWSDASWRHRAAVGGYVAALADLYLFVWQTLSVTAAQETNPDLSSRITGLAHPEYVVTERREVKIYRCTTPTRQSPSAIPGNVDQSTGFGLFARRQPIIKTCNPGFLVIARLGGKSGSGVFLEEGQQFRGLDVFGVRVCAGSDHSKDVLRSQDGQCIRNGCTGDGGEE
jgi:hypothetical protein